jgi:hypothetical protein
MAAFVDVLKTMNEQGFDENSTFQIINNNLMQSSIGSKRTSPSLKIAVPKETAQNFLTFTEAPKQIGILVMVDREKFFETNALLDKEKKEAN